MEITIFEDNFDKESGTIIIDRYICYFLENLQYKVEIDGKTYLEGSNSAQNFLSQLSPQLFQSPDFDRWVNDDKLNLLHKEVKDNGMELCPLNFYTLCHYILSIIKEQYLLLLKPTIADTLIEIKDVRAITFTNADGKKISTNNAELIKLLLENIKAGDNNTYEADRFVRVDKLTDKILLQSSFTYNIALFLKEYFKDYHRRTNCCMVSAIEQKLILYMLYYFGLAPAPLTDSRFRQLIGYYKEHQTRVNYSIFPELGVVPVEIIKYGDWKDGNIKLDKLKYPIHKGDKITFSKDIKIE